MEADYEQKGLEFMLLTLFFPFHLIPQEDLFPTLKLCRTCIIIAIFFYLSWDCPLYQTTKICNTMSILVLFCTLCFILFQKIFDTFFYLEAL